MVAVKQGSGIFSTWKPNIETYVNIKRIAVVMLGTLIFLTERLFNNADEFVL